MEKEIILLYMKQSRYRTKKWHIFIHMQNLILTLIPHQAPMDAAKAMTTQSLGSSEEATILSKTTRMVQQRRG